MQGSMVLIFFLASGSLMGMQQEVEHGVWDESGNYFGPADQMPHGQLVMVPPGFGVFLYPLSQVPYGFPFHTAPMADAQPSVDVSDAQADSWAPGAVESEQAATTQDTHPAPVACASTSNRTKLWIDMDDDDEPPALPADWVRLSRSTPDLPVSVHASPTVVHQKTPLRSDAMSPRNARDVKIAHQVDRHIENDDEDDNLRISSGAASVSDWRKRNGLDQRLALAAQGVDNTQQIMALFGRKVYWLTNKCPKQYRSKECEKFTQLLDTKFGTISICSKDARSLVEMAAECMDTVQHCRYNDTKQGFARLARKLIFIAKPSIEAQEGRRITDWLDGQAQEILILCSEKKN